jgi:hypothetical protein
VLCDEIAIHGDRLFHSSSRIPCKSGGLITRFHTAVATGWSYGFPLPAAGAAGPSLASRWSNRPVFVLVLLVWPRRRIGQASQELVRVYGGIYNSKYGESDQFQVENNTPV